MREFNMPTGDNILPYLPQSLVRSVFKTRATDTAQATALCADVVGFTKISRELSRLGKEGAEELTAILNRYLTTLVDSVYRYGGERFPSLIARRPPIIHEEINSTRLKD
jgi:class 3 adenylate cyclase